MDMCIDMYIDVCMRLQLISSLEPSLPPCVIDMCVDMCLGLCIDICIVGPGSDVGSGVAKNAVAMFSSVANYAVARSRVGIFWRAERLLGARIGKELKCDVALQHMNSQPRIAQLCPKHKTPNKTRPSLLTTRFWPIKSFD